MVCIPLGVRRERIYSSQDKSPTPFSPCSCPSFHLRWPWEQAKRQEWTRPLLEMKKKLGTRVFYDKFNTILTLPCRCDFRTSHGPSTPVTSVCARFSLKQLQLSLVKMAATFYFPLPLLYPHKNPLCLSVHYPSQAQTYSWQTFFRLPPQL